MKRCLSATLLICLTIGSSDLRAEPEDSLASNPRADAFSGDGGLTRNSLEEAAQAPRPVQKPASAPRASVHRRTSRARRAADPSALAVQPPERRRNVFVSFIYAWNGWVIHTFHTTKGTVLLRRVGFKG